MGRDRNMNLQQKIDNIRIEGLWHGVESIDKFQVNKALQEFREQIETLETRSVIGVFNRKFISLEDVVALIGEKSS